MDMKKCDLCEKVVQPHDCESIRVGPKDRWYTDTIGVTFDLCWGCLKEHDLADFWINQKAVWKYKKSIIAFAKKFKK